MGYIDMLLCFDAKILFESDHSLFWSFLYIHLNTSYYEMNVLVLLSKNIQSIKIIKNISSTKILSL